MAIIPYEKKIAGAGDDKTEVEKGKRRHLPSFLFPIISRALQYQIRVGFTISYMISQIKVVEINNYQGNLS